MTDQVQGSSLLQARDGHRHHHNARSHAHAALHRRQEEGAPAEGEPSVIQVVQTIAIVQIVDEAGATLDVKITTLDATQTAEAAAPDTVVTVTALEESPTAVATTEDALDQITALPTTLPSIDLTAPPSMSTTFPTVESYSPITPQSLLPASSNFPSLSGVTNSTSSLYSNGTVTFNALNLTVSTDSASSGTLLFNSSLTTTLDSSATASADASTSDSFGSPTSTGGGLYGGIGGTGSNGGATGTALPSSSSVAGSGSNSTVKETPPATVAGSVLGAVAGVAFILVAALMVLRWKRRRNAIKLRGSDTGLLTAGSFSSPPRGGMSDMAERRSIPFAVPAALASLTGYKLQSQRPGAGVEGERGFQKLGGRKLPSVLQHGGDGYTDPRGSVMSDQSADYRDSVGIFGGPGMPRLAVGSPMRPDSGVPIFHAGSARTPVTEQGHFSPVNSPAAPPPRGSPPRSDSFTMLFPMPPRTDALGRSLTSQDGSNLSHGSGSRFSEHV